MKSLVVILGLLVAAVQAATEGTISDDPTPIDISIPVNEGAPEVAVAVSANVGTEALGSEALSVQFPFQCAVIVNGSFCGGILISLEWVLTSAQCGNQGETFEVKCGCLNWRGSECVDRTTTNRTGHPNYDPRNRTNNIALLRVEDPFPINDPYIRPVVLAPETSGTFEGQTAAVCGWGPRRIDDPVSQSLRWAQLQVISNHECLLYYSNVESSTLCAKDVQRGSTCYEGHGGALVIGQAPTYTLIGVLSFQSSRGCTAGHPTGFTRVSSFQNWILSVTGTL